MTGEPKRLSSSILDMKFMVRSKKKLADKERKKQDVALKNAIQTTSDVEPAAAAESKESRYEQTSNLAILENLTFGRQSFKGFNKDVESLMVYYERLKNGELSDSDDEAGKDVNDQEMASTLGSASLKKKFASKRERQLEGRTDETSGSRLNFSDVRKRGAPKDEQEDDTPKPKFLKPAD